VSQNNTNTKTQSGCRICAWDTYYVELKAFEAARAAAQGRGADGAAAADDGDAPRSPPPMSAAPRPRSAAAASMDAFAELERQIAAGSAEKD